LEEAISDVQQVVKAAGGNIIQTEDRYLYAEFQDSRTGVIDDVEFLFSKDKPLVNYRCRGRSGEDRKSTKQRERIQGLRKALQQRPGEWRSIGRIVTEDI
jgi:uncharacterized protein (DUF1499 family)